MSINHRPYPWGHFEIDDLPYVEGDHIAVCQGCERCTEEEERYFASLDKKKKNKNKDDD